MKKVGRYFESGAYRDVDENKNDFEGFLCPLVMGEFGKYMTKNRKQSDGNIRDSDNWQKGIPKSQYIKSLFRHFHQLWLLHRGYKSKDEKGNLVTIKDACCGIMFNIQGYLHELLKEDLKEVKNEQP